MNRTISINPPPVDKKCMCCGKNSSELKPFGKAGDPLAGDFSGQILIKTFRSMAPEIKDKEFLALQKNYEKYDDFYQEVIDRFGKKKTEQFFFQDQLSSSVGASWECRDCIMLDDDAYFTTKFGEVKNETDSS